MKVNANWNQPQNLQENLSPSGVDDLKEQMFPDDDYSDLPFDIDPIFGDDELEVSAENSEEQASKSAVETHVSETSAAPVTSTSEAEVEVAPAPAPKKVEKKPVEKKTSMASKASKAKKSSVGGGTFKKHLKALRQQNEDLKAETMAQIENAIVEEDATEYVLPSDTKKFLIEMLQSEGLEVDQTSAGYSVNLLDL